MDPWWPVREPVVRLLAEELLAGVRGLQAMLEAMNRRYYKIRELEDCRSRDRRPPVVTGNYELGRQPAVPDLDDRRPRRSGGALTAVDAEANQVADPANLVTDLYVAWADAPEDPDAISAELAAALQDYGRSPAVAG